MAASPHHGPSDHLSCRFRFPASRPPDTPSLGPALACALGIAACFIPFPARGQISDITWDPPETVDAPVNGISAPAGSVAAYMDGQASGRGVPSGIYFAVARAGSTEIRRAIVVAR